MFIERRGVMAVPDCKRNNCGCDSLPKRMTCSDVELHCLYLAYPVYPALLYAEYSETKNNPTFSLPL